MPSNQNGGPVCCVHLDDDVPVPGYLLDIAHPFKITLYRLRRDAITERKLGLGLLALYVIGDHLGFVAPDPAVEAAAAVLA